MSNFNEIRSYLSQQEAFIQKIQKKEDRDAVVRLTLANALETATRNQEVDLDENRELMVFALRYQENLPFRVPTELKKENAADCLRQLKPNEQSYFSTFIRLFKDPIAAILETTQKIGNHSVRDHFGYLGVPNNPDTLRFHQAERNYSDQVLATLPNVNPIRARLTELRESLVSKIDEVVTTPHGIFFTRVTGDKGVSNLFWRPDPTKKEEKLLVDPDSLGTSGKQYRIIAFQPSPTGRFIAVKLLINGDVKSQEYRILDLQSNPPRTVDTIQKVSFKGAWLPDESGFIYTRHPDQIKEMWKDQQVHLHLLKQDQSRDRMLVGNQSSSADYKIESDFSPYVYLAPNSRHLILAFRRGTDFTHFTIITAPIKELQNPKIPWKEISNIKGTKVSDFALQGDNLYLHATENPLKDEDADKDAFSESKDVNGMIVEVSLNHSNPRISNPASSKILLRSSDKIIYPHFSAQPDGLYLFEQQVAIRRPFRVSYQSPSSPEYITGLPDGDAGDYSLRDHVDPRIRGATFPISQWGGELLVYRFDAASRKISPLSLEDRKPISSVSIQSEVIMTKNEDGSPLPITFLYDANKKPNKDGKNKLYAEGYASYGTVYSPGWIGSALELRHRALIEKGWVIAIIHPPGGGELGDKGHQAGRLEKKINSQKGFVAGIKHLHQLGYSSPDYTAIDGRSAGGFLVGWTLTEDQRLIRAFTAHSAVFDGLRLFQDGAGAVNIPEFGDPRKPDQFESIRRSSPYERTVPGKRYPDGLFIYDSRDTNVAHSQFLKMTAALRSAHPENIVLSMETSCGHVYTGCDESQMIDWEAYAIAWLEMEMAKNGPSKK